MRTLVTCLALALGAPVLHAQEQEIPVDADTRIVVVLYWGEVTVIGEDRPSLGITEQHERLERDPTVIASSGAPVVARRGNGELRITQDTTGRGRFPSSAIEVRIPRASSLHVEMLRGGELDIRDVAGDTEITNHNGSVALTDVSGALRITAMNGAITGSLRDIGPSASFASLNGEIDLSLPANAALTARLRTSNGRVRSEFTVQVEERVSSPEDGVEVRARINGGGVPFIATTRSGDIVLRRRDTSRQSP